MPIDPELLRQSRTIQLELWSVASKYNRLRDARWMFAFAHFRITQQINENVNRHLFRSPEQLLRFNLSFATAFLAAAAGQTTAPWRKAFELCEGYVTAAMYQQPGCEYALKPLEPCRVMASVDVRPIIMCSIAMADAHINTDIVTALETVGCIDAHDYGNILLFVERGARDTIYRLTGSLIGPVANAVKRSLLPLDKTWRNAAYQRVCHMPVPRIEEAFKDAIERNSAAMMNVRPSVN